MGSIPIPVPDDPAASQRCRAATALLRSEWRLSEKFPATLEHHLRGQTSTADPHDRADDVELFRGHFTNFPTWCLICWPASDDQPIHSELLRQVLVAAHIDLLQQINNEGKKYSARLQESFRAYRLLNQSDRKNLLIMLPEHARSQREYLEKLPESGKFPRDTRDSIRRALEAAISSRGGHTRNVGARQTRLRRRTKSQRVETPEYLGDLVRSAEQTNSHRMLTSLRLASDEAWTGSVTFRSDEIVLPEKGDSVAQAAGRARGARRSIQRMHQLFPFSNERLGFADIRAFHDLIAEACNAAVGKTSIAAAEASCIANLSFWTGRSLAELRDVRQVRSLNDLPASIANNVYIVRDPVIVVAPPLRPEGARPVANAWANLVEPVSDRIYLPLPAAARQHVEPWLAERQPSGSKGRRLFPAESAEQHESVMKAALKQVRKRGSARTTLLRLERHMSVALANSAGDRDIAAAAMAMPVAGMTATGNYYLSTTQTFLARHYWNLAESLSRRLTNIRSPEKFPALPEAADTNRVGSNVFPRPRLFEFHRADLLENLRWIREIEHTSGHTQRYHNCLTGYCVQMLGALTGYRAVRSPMKSRSNFDWRTGFLVISDKDFDDHHNSRLVWVPAVLAEQIEVYAAYRQFIVRNLGISHDEFFFLLDEQRTPVTVRPKHLSRLLEPGWPIPLNANRHRLKSYLTEEEVPGEIIDAFMGHWDLGEECWAGNSALSPVDLRVALRGPLERLARADGWIVAERHWLENPTSPDET